MHALDATVCHAALRSRDARFDGLFFVGVATTGVYCRPICPARTPRADRCHYFPTSAAAERAGYRACFRCRPELAPGAASVDANSRLAREAAKLIEAGALNEGSVADLADTLGVTDRHLRRVVGKTLGASPVELALTRRLAIAKQLLQDTGLGYTEVAYASGFNSVRRFNAAFRERFGAAPSRLRESTRRRPDDGLLTLRLDARPPFDWARLLAFFAPRAIPGVEAVDGERYLRVLRLGSEVGRLEVRFDAERTRLIARIPASLSGRVLPLVAGLRRLFDVDARPDVIAAALGRDEALAPLLARRPGLRLPGSLDAFETTVRAILGQQVSVAAATTLSGRLVATFGTPLGELAESPLTHSFPEPARLAAASVDEVAGLGLPRRRAESLKWVAEAVVAGRVRFAGAAASWPRFRAALTSISGIGEWTAQYLAMRVLNRPDALPASDLGLRKALGGISAGQVRERAEPWRPWRAYAALHLWTALAEGELP